MQIHVELNSAIIKIIVSPTSQIFANLDLINANIEQASLSFIADRVSADLVSADLVSVDLV